MCGVVVSALAKVMHMTWFRGPTELLTHTMCSWLKKFIVNDEDYVKNFFVAENLLHPVVLLYSLYLQFL